MMVPSPHHALLRLGRDPADQAAWAEAVDAYAGLCWRVAIRMLGDEADAADAVQDCLLAIRSAAARFDPGADPSGAAIAWVARIAVNTCHAWRRRERRPRQALPASLAAAAPTDDIAEHLPALRTALDALPRGQREAIAMRYLAGLDNVAVARGLGIDEGAVRVRVHRGLTRLRALMSRRAAALPAAAPVAALEHLSAAAPPPLPAPALSGWQAAVFAAPSTSLLGIIAMPLLAASALGIVLAASGGDAPPVASPPAAPTSAWSMADGQSADGWWAPQPGDASAEARIATTAKTLLGLLSAGYDHIGNTRYRPAVARGLGWLMQQPARTDDPAADALRAITLCEAFGMTADIPVGEAAIIAVARLIEGRPPAAWQDGGQADAAEIRRRVFFIMALRSLWAADEKSPLLARSQTAARAWIAGMPVPAQPDPAGLLGIYMTVACIYTGERSDGQQFRRWSSVPYPDPGQLPPETRWMESIACYERIDDKEHAARVQRLRADLDAARRAGRQDDAACLILALLTHLRHQQRREEAAQRPAPAARERTAPLPGATDF